VCKEFPRYCMILYLLTTLSFFVFFRQDFLTFICEMSLIE
jgi:hypothetical protein